MKLELLLTTLKRNEKYTNNYARTIKHNLGWLGHNSTLLAVVESCLEPVATVVKERVVISLQVTRVPVPVKRSNISDATLAIALKAQPVKAS